ncbi:hypothetical protein MCP1_240041 [Candidatus Terasakiella magnetica]|nr:hypothetical protein MCP1_240041 [Candidatus Terasakiella magnetica]
MAATAQIRPPPRKVAKMLDSGALLDDFSACAIIGSFSFPTIRPWLQPLARTSTSQCTAPGVGLALKNQAASSKP